MQANRLRRRQHRQQQQEPRGDGEVKLPNRRQNAKCLRRKNHRLMKSKRNSLTLYDNHQTHQPQQQQQQPSRQDFLEFIMSINLEEDEISDMTWVAFDKNHLSEAEDDEDDSICSCLDD